MKGSIENGLRSQEFILRLQQIMAALTILGAILCRDYDY